MRLCIERFNFLSLVLLNFVSLFNLEFHILLIFNVLKTLKLLLNLEILFFSSDLIKEKLSLLLFLLAKNF